MYKELIEKLSIEFDFLNQETQKAQEQINQFRTRQVEIQGAVKELNKLQDLDKQKKDVKKK